MKTNRLVLIILLFHLLKTNAQTLNKEVNEDGKTPYLIGKIDKNGLQGDHYQSWFNTNFNNYKVNTDITSALTPKLEAYTITLFMGTWCGDSKKEVPRLYKVLEASNFPMKQLTVVAVSKAPNMYKQSPNHEEAGLNIHRVPTVIFYKNGKEINRIVEHPIASFEEDIQNIITTNTYKSNYQIVSATHNILKTKGIKGLERKSKKIIKTYKSITENMFALNTYGRVLYSQNKIDEAIAVFKLNTQLFPDNPRTFMSLANTLGVNNKKEDAINVMKYAIRLHPDNDNLKENLETIISN